MKKGIHPEYRQVAFHDTSVDEIFIIGSTLKTDRTIEHEGKIYPYLTIDVSSASHPFYTGKQRMVEGDSRVAKFKQRFKMVNSK